VGRARFSPPPLALAELASESAARDGACACRAGGFASDGDELLSHCLGQHPEEHASDAKDDSQGAYPRQRPEKRLALALQELSEPGGIRVHAHQVAILLADRASTVRADHLPLLLSFIKTISWSFERAADSFGLAPELSC
jgi:hypothetical protein